MFHERACSRFKRYLSVYMRDIACVVGITQKSLRKSLFELAFDPASNLVYH